MQRPRLIRELVLLPLFHARAKSLTMCLPAQLLYFSVQIRQGQGKQVEALASALHRGQSHPSDDSLPQA